MPLPHFLSRRLLGLAASVRTALASLAWRAAGRLLHFVRQARARRAQRQGMVEVHLADGQVAFVEVPQRRQQRRLPGIAQ